MSRPKRRAAMLACVAGLGTAGWLWLLPVTTRQGVNFEVSSHRLPLYVKVLDFLQRHAHYRLLARQITAECGRDPARRALAIFDWTREHVPPTPAGAPVIDDHILHIIIRGHGTGDQMADVFTTLATYAGLPAFWRVLKVPGAEHELILSFVKVGDGWAAFDVQRGLVFRRPDGRLARVGELAADSELVRAGGAPARLGPSPYEAYFSQLAQWRVPRPLRAELQMPGRRLWYEASRRVPLLEKRHGS